MTTTDTKPRPTLDEEAEYYRLLWYADPGGGKTTNIADAARYGRVIYIDAENGLKAAALRRHGIPTKNIEPYRDVTYDGLKALHHEVRMRLADGEDIYALAWDTTTKTLAQFLEDVSTSRTGEMTASGRARDEFDLFQDDYGTGGTQMRRILRKFHDLPVHLLVGAHQRRDQDEEGKVRVGPAVTPAVQQDLAGYMDLVIHCRVSEFEDDPDLIDGMEFSGLTRPSGRFMAKDRFGLTPKNLVEPTFTRVRDYLDGKLDKNDDPLQAAARSRRMEPESKAKTDGVSEKETADTAA